MIRNPSELTAEQIAAVATTMELARKRPPSAESWSRPGEVTLEDALRAWLKECL